MLETRVARIEKSLANSGSLIGTCTDKCKVDFGLFGTNFFVLTDTSKQILRPQMKARGQLHDTMHRVDMLETRVAQIEKSLANSSHKTI